MARAVSGTLTPDEVTTVTLTGVGAEGIEIINRSQTGVIWYRVDGGTPAAGGDNSHPVLGARRVDNPYSVDAKSVVVKLISADALDYTIEADPRWIRA